ncbi:hypothetical protein G7046_g1711 [Stylonectria norvegica]|nr:hypothetical protein G7046_g1711 [Stylonectria norvegica]
MFDESTGQVFEERTLPRELLTKPPDWSRHRPDPLSKPYGTQGPRSLVETAINVVANNIGDISDDHLEPLPAYILWRVWRLLESRGACLHAWKLLSKILLKEDDQKTLALYHFREHICHPADHLVRYTKPLTSISAEFITHIVISGGSSFTTNDMLCLADVKNLGVLEIIQPHDQLRTLFPQITDRLVRGWTEMDDPFPLLRILRIWGDESTTQESLQWVSKFPSLALYDVVGFKGDWLWPHDVAQEHGWQLAGGSDAPEESLLSYMMDFAPLEETNSAKLHDLSKSIDLDLTHICNDSSCSVKFVKDHQLPLLLDCLTDNAKNNIGARSPAAPVEEARGCHGHGFAFETWAFWMYAFIGQLSKDQDLKKRGFESLTQAVTGSYVLPSKPLASLYLGHSNTRGDISVKPSYISRGQYGTRKFTFTRESVVKGEEGTKPKPVLKKDVRTVSSAMPHRKLKRKRLLSAVPSLTAEYPQVAQWGVHFQRRGYISRPRSFIFSSPDSTQLSNSFSIQNFVHLAQFYSYTSQSHSNPFIMDDADVARKNRIISHMNKEHTRELTHYLRHYAQVPRNAASSPVMRDLAEVKSRIIEMDEVARESLGISDIYITEYAPPEGVLGISIFSAVLFYTFCAASLPWVVEGSSLWELLEVVFPGGPTSFRWVVKAIFVPVIGVHLFECWLFEKKLQKHGVESLSGQWWAWQATCFFEGFPSFKRVNRIVETTSSSCNIVAASGRPMLFQPVPSSVQILHANDAQTAFTQVVVQDVFWLSGDVDEIKKHEMKLGIVRVGDSTDVYHAVTNLSDDSRSMDGATSGRLAGDASGEADDVGWQAMKMPTKIDNFDHDGNFVLKIRRPYTALSSLSPTDLSTLRPVTTPIPTAFALCVAVTRHIGGLIVVGDVNTTDLDHNNSTVRIGAMDEGVEVISQATVFLELMRYVTNKSRVANVLVVPEEETAPFGDGGGDGYEFW